ncbi:transcription factor/nuclear export subunit protein 2-domain-containing protein [Irpex rosettiformis]|uniref:Transcription factor/nuclear export subunit protein 2-domain-containing protein n=1 Tax=Irpex rosettiformis TaxID=378272 RepID=A0ACB8UD77_9APHY|nr:transcription factor/nuclear export subunit protein 2-domain-containing protein [Irpex rosettiformis]
MDVVESVRSSLNRWESGGEAECRSLLATPHSNPADQASNDLLSTVYHTLITSTLLSWQPENTFSFNVLADFIQSVLGNLPSPSTTKSSSAIAFSELLIDLLWAVDVELDDIHADSNATLGNADKVNAVAGEGIDQVAAVTRVARVKQNAEADKQTLARLIQKLVTVGVLDANVCRERLELPLLHASGLIVDEQAFSKKEIRMRTGLFYKQNKFNLLREQSEGYSKLTAELTSSIGPAHSAVDGYPMESLSAIEARARPAWERVVGLIGYFDLDPNRALDIILDVFSVHLATHYSFFLSLLSFSPWAGSLKYSADSMAVESSLDIYRGKDLDEVLKLAEGQAGVSLDPPPPAAMGANKSRVLAQVLGFKFAHYQGTDTTEQTPRSLYLTAALLIREGFITLEDLYPHISPSTDEIADIYEQYQASVESRIVSARVSMLAMAAPLESSGSSSRARQSTQAEQAKPNGPKEAPNQILGLLDALLSIGNLRPAIALLTKYPWMVDAFPELADLLLRILKHSISKLYETTWPSGPDKSSFSKAKARFANTGLVSAPERRVHITLMAPAPPSTSTTTYLFFYPNWTERIPMCSSTEDIVDVIEPLMSFVGIHISRDVNFLSKFLRIGRSHVSSITPVNPETKKPIITTDLEHPTRQFWYKVLRQYLLPALPLVRGNAVCAVEVWNILRQYDVTLRWRLYGELKASAYKSHAELRVRAIQADRESKGILRRLSMQTIDSLAGAVAKLAHSDPCLLFTNAVTQIMAYQNMANCILQALNYVTVMGFDVLLYIVLEALANPKKDRVKDDGVNTSDWLQNLASFTGQLYRRYSADLTPMIRYIVHQLQNGQTSELVVLQEVIRHMTGISPLPNMTDSQVIAMAGGPYLRIEAISSVARGARLEPGDMTLKGPQRLGRALTESQLARPLLIQVAQQRQKCVYQPPTPNAPLKSLASLYDTCHGVLLQYIELLVSPTVVPLADYASKILPPLVELHRVYGIPAPICMHMIRPILSSKLLEAALTANNKERIASEEAEKRLKAALTAKRDPSTTTPRVGSPVVGDTVTLGEHSQGSAPLQGEDVVMNGTETSQPTALQNPWQPELYERFDEIKSIAPPSAMEIIGPGFYLTFWQMSTYDIAPPLAKYEEETANLRALSRQEDSKYISADRSSDRTKRLSASQHRSKRDRYNSFANLLAQESKDQVTAMGYTKKRMAKEKQHWFVHNPKGATLAAALVEHCFHPRALISPMDADFCSQIIKVMHSLGTPGFSTLNTYDKLLSDHIKTVIFSCTEYEAQNYGRFLLGILTDLYKWHQDEQLFSSDNRSKGTRVSVLPGFMYRFSNKTVVAAEDLVVWPTFRTLVRKWHRKLLKCVIDGIETGEYMHVYNSLVVLKEVLPIFPCAAVLDSAGSTIQHTVDRFLEKEKRGDLRIFGNSYAAGLKKRESFWAPPTKSKVRIIWPECYAPY